MSPSPPQNDDPSSRYSFDDPSPEHPSQRKSRRSTTDETETLGDTLLEEVDDALGISQRLLGCSWWLLTLPFRLLWKGIGLFMDVF